MQRRTLLAAAGAFPAAMFATKAEASCPQGFRWDGDGCVRVYPQPSDPFTDTVAHDRMAATYEKIIGSRPLNTPVHPVTGPYDPLLRNFGVRDDVMNEISWAAASATLGGTIYAGISLARLGMSAGSAIAIAGVGGAFAGTVFYATFATGTLIYHRINSTGPYQGMNPVPWGSNDSAAFPRTRNITPPPVPNAPPSIPSNGGGGAWWLIEQY